MKIPTRIPRSQRLPGLSQLAGLAVMGSVFLAAEVAVRVEHSLASLAERRGTSSRR